MKTLKNKVAIVTGGSSGIGEATVKKLAAEGAKVFFSYRSHSEEAEGLAKSLKDQGAEVDAYYLDISKVSSIEEFFKAAVAKFGNPDISVLNAGGGSMGPILETEEEEFDRVFDMNAKGTFFSLRESGKVINHHGTILMVSSSTTVRPQTGVAVYAGSKSPIKLYAEVASKEFGKRDVTVNAIMPGVTLTRMAEALPDEFKDLIQSQTPLDRVGEPEDVANVIYNLVNPDGHWINGQIVLANGGR